MRTANIAIQTEDTSLAHWVWPAGHHLQESVLSGCNGLVLLPMLAMVAFALAVVRTMAFALVHFPVIFVMLLVSLLPLVKMLVLRRARFAGEGNA